jgi:type VI secretion system protein ImpE
MATADDIQSLLKEDRLEDAAQLLNQEVRTRPAATEVRALLAEVLCLNGNLERADTVLDAITSIDPGAAVGVALFRQLIRAEQARTQFYLEGRLPEFIAKPDGVLELELRAAVALREGNLAEASAQLAESEAARAPAPGTADGAAFDDFRDMDDSAAAHLEVLTPNGKYFWIPVASVATIELRRPERRRDLLWRRAHVSVESGPDGEVFLPTTYFARDPTPAQRLGHVTDYATQPGGAVLGRGLREFMVGEEVKTILELGKLQFSGRQG